MQVQRLAPGETSYRVAGWSAIASGAAGIIATMLLIAYLVLRSADGDQWMTINTVHDVMVIFQMILLIPVISVLYKLSYQQPHPMSRLTFIAGIATLSCTTLFLLLGILKTMAEVLYMFPQGIFGIWLLVFCLRNGSSLTRGHKRFGILVGVGLALVGLFPLEYALFVDTIILSIPAAPLAQIEKIPVTSANMIVHQILFIGTPMGVLTLPFWTVWLGCRLLRERALVVEN